MIMDKYKETKMKLTQWLWTNAKKQKNKVHVLVVQPKCDTMIMENFIYTHELCGLEKLRYVN